jgi:hypothetical protein
MPALLSMAAQVAATVSTSSRQVCVVIINFSSQSVEKSCGEKLASVVIDLYSSFNHSTLLLLEEEEFRAFANCSSL